MMVFIADTRTTPPMARAAKLPICAPSMGKHVRMIASTRACSSSLVAVKGYGAGVYSAMTQLKEILSSVRNDKNSHCTWRRGEMWEHVKTCCCRTEKSENV